MRLFVFHIPPPLHTAMEHELVVNPDERKTGQINELQADKKFALVDKRQKIVLQIQSIAIDSIRQEANQIV
jgi:hypothetical protein